MCVGPVTTLSGQPLQEAQVSFFQLEGIQGNSPSEHLIQRTLTNTNLNTIKVFQRDRIGSNFYSEGTAILKFASYLWRGRVRYSMFAFRRLMHIAGVAEWQTLRT